MDLSNITIQGIFKDEYPEISKVIRIGHEEFQGIHEEQVVDAIWNGSAPDFYDKATYGRDKNSFTVGDQSMEDMAMGHLLWQKATDLFNSRVDVPAAMGDAFREQMAKHVDNALLWMTNNTKGEICILWFREMIRSMWQICGFRFYAPIKDPKMAGWHTFYNLYGKEIRDA